MTAADWALYASIWTGVVLFVAGEVAKRRRRPASGWGWYLWTAGACLTGAHTLIALAVAHGWEHGAAIEATARQTESVYGVGWRGGIYVNYVFLAAWISEIVWWRLNPEGYFARSAALTMVLRSFYFVVLVNAAVVFASPPRRAAGLALMAALLWAWRPPPAVRAANF